MDTTEKHIRLEPVLIGLESLRSLRLACRRLKLNDGQVEDTSLSQALQGHFTPLTALAFLVFVLLYIPCIATMGAIKQEFGGRWAASAAVYQTLFAWLIAVAVFQGGRLLGLG